MFGKGKKDKNYFYDCFYNLAEYAIKAFDELSKGMKSFDGLDLEKFKDDVHKYEHEADQKKEEYEESLAKEFSTPIDREDIFLLLDAIDDLTDAIDDISYKLFLRNYTSLPVKTNEFIDETKVCLDDLMVVLKDFKHFADKKVIYPLIQKVKDDEAEMDKLYEQEVHQLYKENLAYDKSRFDEVIYGSFEYITDKCRDICKEILIVMYKNL